LGLAPSPVVAAVVRSAAEPPDLTPFNELIDATAGIDFNKCFSDPKMIERQYRQELIDDMNSQIEKNKARRKAERKREKAEPKHRSGMHVARREAVICALAKPPEFPLCLVVPPPPGEAVHGVVPASLPQSAHAEPAMEPSPSPARVQPLPRLPPPPPPTPPPAAPPPDLISPRKLSHIDLIKSGAFKLRKVDRDAPLAQRPCVMAERKENPDMLTLQDILQKAASIREATARSDSSSTRDDDTESSAW
jgi:hypothetical protein